MKTISYLFAAMAAIAVVCGCKGNSGSNESEEEAVEKTAVSVETLTGVWGAEGGYVLMLYVNGVYERGYDVANEIGRYSVDGDKVILHSVYNAFDEENSDTELVYDESTGKLGEFIKQEFINDYEIDGGGYGLITEFDFSVATDAVEEMVNSGKNPFKD